MERTNHGQTRTKRHGVLSHSGPEMCDRVCPQKLGGDPSIHVHTMYRDPTNDYGRSLLRFENLHQSQISAYQVNCLMPANAAVRIASEHRNYSQSLYELEYTESIRSPS